MLTPALSRARYVQSRPLSGRLLMAFPLTDWPTELSVVCNSGASAVTSTVWLMSPACKLKSTTADRKSTRLNSSHLGISYAVFCLKKKNQKQERRITTNQYIQHTTRKIGTNETAATSGRKTLCTESNHNHPYKQNVYETHKSHHDT